MNRLPTIGYPGYLVSDTGEVFSYWRFSGKEWFIDYSRPPKQRKISRDGLGRAEIKLVNEHGLKESRLVGTLVLEAFVGPRPDGLECCHFDDNPRNNSLENLRWDTRLSNVEDKKRNGRTRRGERHRSHKLTEPQVREIRARFSSGEKMSQMAREFGITETSIQLICHRVNWAWLE